MSIILSQSSNIFLWIHARSKALTIPWQKFLSYRNQSIDLFWFLYNNKLRLKIQEALYQTYTKSLFLHVGTHYSLLFFSTWLFFHEYSRFTGQQVKRGDGGKEGWSISLYPFYHFHPLHRHLDISWVIAAESSPLRIAGSRNRTWNLWYTLFRIHSFYTCTGSCCC